MEVTFRGMGTNPGGGNTATDVTGDVPTGTALDDVLIVPALSGASQSHDSVSDDGGNTYSLIADNNQNGDLTSSFWWTRVASVPTQYTVSRSGGGGCFLGNIYGFFGCISTGTPYESATLSALGGSPINTTTPTTAIVTASGDGRYPVYFACIDDDPDFSSGNPPSGYDDLGGLSTTQGTDARIEAIARQAALDNGQSTTTVTFGTLPDSAFWQVLNLLLIPEPAPAGDLVPRIVVSRQSVARASRW